MTNLTNHLANKNVFGLICDLETVVDAPTDHPNDVAVRGSQKPSRCFLLFRKLLVHKEIAQKLRAFHAQGMEAVAMPPVAQGQRELQFVEIQLGNFS